MNHLILAVLLTFSGAIKPVEVIAESVCNPNPCKNGATCELGDGGTGWGFTCKCQPGFQTGLLCQWDSRRCDANTKTPCKNGGKCVSGDDGRFCVCPGDTATTIRYGGYYCEIENPCASCPSNTAYCQPRPIVASGRACIDAMHMEIPE